jgi:hypothetical protein
MKKDPDVPKPICKQNVMRMRSLILYSAVTGPMEIHAFSKWNWQHNVCRNLTNKFADDPLTYEHELAFEII